MKKYYIVKYRITDEIPGEFKVAQEFRVTFYKKGDEKDEFLSAIYAVSSNQQILGMATAEDVAEMQKDSRLKFHACPK